MPSVSRCYPGVRGHDAGLARSAASAHPEWERHARAAGTNGRDGRARTVCQDLGCARGQASRAHSGPTVSTLWKAFGVLSSQAVFALPYGLALAARRIGSTIGPAVVLLHGCPSPESRGGASNT